MSVSGSAAFLWLDLQDTACFRFEDGQNRPGSCIGEKLFFLIIGQAASLIANRKLVHPVLVTLAESESEQVLRHEPPRWRVGLTMRNPIVNRSSFRGIVSAAT